MVIIRPTKNLAARAGVKSLTETDTASTTALGDWYALDFSILRQQFILCVSANGRLPVVIEAAPYKRFPDRLMEMLPRVMHALDVPAEKISRELVEMTDQRFAKTADRSLVGSLNQYSKDLEASVLYGSHPPGTLLECSLFLAEGICMPLPEKVPAKAMQMIFAKPRLRLVH